MPTIAATGDTPLIRTDFSDDAAWRALAAAAVAPSPEGFQAYVEIVEDRGFEGATPAQLAEAAGGRRGCLIVADAVAIHDDEHPFLCLELAPAGRSFRVIPRELWGVENNLSLANMDFEEFADAADPDGVFRGFPE
ncbi:MAG: hypothetical protein JO276_06125 [Sphingomonadaceae bacterium]|nr:hypothetical protein [Sphingomonadaceae bacterium]